MLQSLLIVDDHKVTALGYKSILEQNEIGIAFTFTICSSLQDAYKTVTSSNAEHLFNIVFLDRSMSPYAEKNISSGEDLIPIIRKQIANVKIVILTSIAEKFSIYDIIHKNRPDAMLIKSDVDDENLIECIQCILNNQSYHSLLVREALKEEINTKGYFDTIDRQIITLLSQGFRNVSIADKLGLSASAVEKRKAKIKDYLNVDGNDEEIIKESRRLGYI